MPSSNIGSVWLGRPGLRTFDAKSDFAAFAYISRLRGSEHISEFIFEIFPKFGVHRVFGGTVGIPCVELRFGFGLSG